MNDPHQISDFVWLQTAFLGDIILTTAAIKLAHERFPRARQHLITTSVGARALAGISYLQSIVTFDKKQGWSAMGTVKQQLEQHGITPQRSVLLQPHLSVRSSLLARYLRLPTVTFVEAGLSFLAERRVNRVAVFHEAERIALLLEALGIERSHLLKRRPVLEALPFLADVPWQQQLQDHRGPVVGIAPGSRWGTKCWPVERFAELAFLLQRELKVGLVLLGGPEDAHLARRIATHLNPNLSPVFDLTGKTDLLDLRRLFPRLQLVVANDSAPVHYASAFDIPTVAIFGATTPELGFGPLASRSIVMERRDLTCRPCSDHGPMTCPLTHFRCMRELGVNPVFAACRKLLELV